MTSFVTVAETAQFSREAADILSTDELEELKGFVAGNPEAGVVISGGGGVRKLRWAVRGRGKRGGSRVIYYYHNLAAPLFLITIFTKNQKSDLSADELKAAKQFAESIAAEHKKRK